MQRGVTCERAYQELYQYLDRELNEMELEVVQMHLEACPPCAHLYRFEGVIVRYVREQAPRESCPATTVMAILQRFRARVTER